MALRVGREKPGPHLQESVSPLCKVRGEEGSGQQRCTESGLQGTRTRSGWVEMRWPQRSSRKRQGAEGYVARMGPQNQLEKAF